tara:strand:+ start:730 stop:1512 length:783 start_codon:yes stop_codon:yes gene_type:complete
MTGTDAWDDGSREAEAGLPVDRSSGDLIPSAAFCTVPDDIRVRNPLSHRSGWLTRCYRCHLKRCLDVVFAMVALVVALPVLVLASILIKCNSRGPVLYVQHRLGRDGQRFQVLKLRTMTDRLRTAHVQVFDGDPEVTRVGHFLRRTKIDELPQLWNVIRGDMSIVGPRPGLPEHLKTYDERGLHRLLVRPGLTGLAQVHGNIHLSWPHRWLYDAWYVDHLAPGLDAWIVLRTVAVVWRGEQHYAPTASRVATEQTARRAA